MAHKTQMRLHQVSGSIIDLAYSGSLTSAAADTALDHSGMHEVLGQIVGSIGRISGKNSTGANAFTNAAAGTFYQSLVPGTDDTYDLGSSAAAWQDGYFEGDLILTDAGKLSAAAGVLTLECVDSDVQFSMAAGNDINIQQNIGLVFGNDGEKIEGNGTDLTLRGGDINLTAEGDVNLPSSIGVTFGDDGEKIEGDGTDLTVASSAKINLTATSDVHLPNNVGMVFGDAAEKIEGDGTDLTVAGNNIKLTAVADVILPSGVGLVLDGSGAEKIESDGTDINFAVGANGDINIPADIGLTFGADGEKIEGDGSELSIAAANVAFSIEAGGDIQIPQDIGLIISNDGAEKIEGDGTDINFTVGAGGDINIGSGIGLTFGDDGEKIEGDGTDLTVAGNNINLTAVADVNIPSGVGLTFATSEKIESDGTDLTIATGGGGKINLSATVDVIVPADVGVSFGNDGEKIEGDGTDLAIATSNNLDVTVANKFNIDAQGTDSGDGMEITLGTDTSAVKFALKNNSGTEKFSVDGAGTATFANDVTITGNLDVNGTTTTIDTANMQIQDSIIGLGVSGSGAFSNVGERAIVFARSANSFDALPAMSWDGTQFNMGKYLASPASQSMGTVSSYSNLRVNSLLANGLTNNRVVIAGTNGLLEDDANFTFDGSDLALGANIGLTFGAAGEKIEGDGSELSVAAANVAFSIEAGGDIQIPQDIGLIISNDGAEKIEGDGTDINIAIGAGGDLNLGSAIGLTFGDDGEKIEGNGTKLTIASSDAIDLTATTDVVLPSSVGMIFGDAGEKIEGDGTDLTIAGNNINLTAVADVNIPSDVGLTFATAEKIESDGTDMTLATGGGGDINLSAAVDVNIPADVGLTFGADGEKIEGDGTEMTIAASNVSFSIEAGGDVAIPANVGLILDGSGNEKIESDGTNINIAVGAGGDVKLPNSIGMIFGDAGEKIEADGTDMTIASSGLLNLNVTTAAVMPSGIPIRFADSGESISGNGTNLSLASGADINLNATADINVPVNVGLTFGGSDNEKIEGDGTDLSIASTGTISTSCTFFEVGNGTANQARFKLYEDGTNGGNYIEFRAPESITANVVFQLPDGDGDDGQLLQTNGSGVTSWATVGGGASVKTYATVADAVHAANTSLSGDSGFSATDYSNITLANASKSIDVFVNGQLLQSGSGPYSTDVSSASYTSGDYLIDFSDGGANLSSLDVKFAFALEKDDVVCIIGRA